MKLKDANKTGKQSVRRIVYFLGIIFLISMMIESTMRIGFSLMYLIPSGLMVGVMIGVIYLIADRLNYEFKHLKEEGTKVEGKVIGIGDVKDGVNTHCYIVVSFEDEVKRVKYLEYNYAYSVLNMLLDGYPVKEMKDIPIDIYVKGKKFYADLDSVELEKIEGFEEAKKLVIDMQDDMTL